MVKIPFKLVSISFIGSIVLGLGSLSASAQSYSVSIAQTPTNSQDPNATPTEDLRPLTQADSLLSVEGAEKLMQEASAAITAEKYDVAAEKLNQARRIFNQLSNYHLKLATLYAGIDRKVVEAQRNSALETGQKRDEATYQLALVHRAQNQPELAVPLLIQIIESQNPSSDLGKKSYQQLYELGFVNIPLDGSSTPTTSSNPTPPQK